jgi:hypothetical protein
LYSVEQFPRCDLLKLLWAICVVLNRNYIRWVFPN